MTSGSEMTTKMGKKRTGNKEVPKCERDLERWTKRLLAAANMVAVRNLRAVQAEPCQRHLLVAGKLKIRR